MPASDRISLVHHDVRTLLNQREAYWRAKLIMRCIAVVSSILAAAIFIYCGSHIITRLTDNARWTTPTYNCALTATFSTAYLISTLSGTMFQAVPPYPPVSIFLELVCTFGFLWTGIFAGFYPALIRKDYTEENFDRWLRNTGDVKGEVKTNIKFKYNEAGADRAVSPLTAASRAGIVFVSLSCFIHLVLFVLACMATHRWRKTRKTNRISRFEMDTYSVHESGKDLPSYEAPSYQSRSEVS
ncbi:MAG: hypothetical protein M1833_000259 [Piccolia ochrophora]|nr:MAG: hypothetical protein M1833_000259 [Piccolia ochrophora]